VVELNLDALSKTKSKPQTKIGDTAQTKICEEKSSAAAEILEPGRVLLAGQDPGPQSKTRVQAAVTKASSKIHA
jgi:hypothetical protein